MTGNYYYVFLSECIEYRINFSSKIKLTTLEKNDRGEQQWAVKPTDQSSLRHFL